MEETSMALSKRGLGVVAIAGALAISTLCPLFAADAPSAASRKRAAAPAPEGPRTPTKADFKTSDLEYYLTDDGIAYIRPGVKVKLVAITNVAAGQKPVVEFYLTDNFDNPLDRAGKVTPGPIAPSFILATWNPTTRYYSAYTLRTRSGVTVPSADTGTFTDLEMGHYKYNFGTALPATLDATATLTLGIYARRTLNDIIGKDYYADNVLLDFRADGQKPTAVWGATNTTNTCNTCHDPKASSGGTAAHGGTRRDAELCMLCHQTQISSDATSGNTFNGKVFFHKLHMGKNLPSVIAGTPYVAASDWSNVGFPQDIRNCTACHDPKAPESNIWYTRPSRAVCGSCHDNVNFATGVNHAGGKQLDDVECAKCHVPDSGVEFDASIKGAHTLPLMSKQLKGITASVISVSNFAAGKKPTAVFSLKNADGTPIDATKITSFAPMFAGPTGSYTTYVRESALTKGVYDPATGYTSYTFTGALPADASGTWAVSADIERAYSLVRGDGQTNITGNESTPNPVKYYSLDPKQTATARRVVVTMAQCNQCHNDLRLHGGQRLNTVQCVMCHNPVKGDEDRRPANGGAVESVSFQRLIHRIHSGDTLTQQFTVIGFGGSTNNFNEVGFPGDRKNCAKCHSSSSYTLPVATSAAPVKTLRDYFTPQGPGTAACLGCHDNVDAAAHAYLNTTNFGGTTTAEACATCHSTGKDWAVEKVHAQ
jgi:OmcA/MtrC family decaheme c-type cytochrome